MGLLFEFTNSMKCILQPDCNYTRGPRKDHSYMPLWYLCFQKDVIWAMHCPCYFPAMYDVDVL